MIRGIMLTLIEGVTVMITAYTMRQQQMMQEEQMAIQKKELERVMRRGGPDAWDVGFDQAKADL